MENAFSAYHCSQECHSDPECKVFSWKPDIGTGKNSISLIVCLYDGDDCCCFIPKYVERNCFLMYQNALEQGGKNIRWTNDGAVSSTKDCSILLDHFSS